MRRITRAVACGSRGWEWVPQECFQGQRSTQDHSPAHEDTDTLPRPGWELWPGHPPRDRSPPSCTAQPCSAVAETAPGTSSFGKQRGKEEVCEAPTVLPGKVMLQAELVADVADAKEGLGTRLCTATLR